MGDRLTAGREALDLEMWVRSPLPHLDIGRTFWYDCCMIETKLWNHEVKAKDESVLDTTKVRINGMVRRNRRWLPIDYYSLDHEQEFIEFLHGRKMVGQSLPKFRHWKATYRESSPQQKAAVNHYFMQHGTTAPYPGVSLITGMVSMKEMKKYAGKLAIEQGYTGFDDYHNWYMENVMSKEPHRGAPKDHNEYWPIILSVFEDEAWQDGSHRFHQYVEMGLSSIPVLVFENEYDKIDNVIKSWALRQRKLNELAY